MTSQETELAVHDKYFISTLLSLTPRFSLADEAINQAAVIAGCLWMTFTGGFRVSRLGTISSKVNKSVEFVEVHEEEAYDNLRRPEGTPRIT